MEKNTVSVNGFKEFDISSVANQKGSLVQYYENTRVITGAKTVTKHLATDVTCNRNRCNTHTDVTERAGFHATVVDMIFGGKVLHMYSVWPAVT